MSPDALLTPVMEGMHVELLLHRMWPTVLIGNAGEGPQTVTSFPVTSYFTIDGKIHVYA